jgi:hypothetical protein
VETKISPHHTTAEAAKWEMLNRNQNFVAFDKSRVILNTKHEGMLNIFSKGLFRQLLRPSYST